MIARLYLSGIRRSRDVLDFERVSAISAVLPPITDTRLFAYSFHTFMSTMEDEKLVEESVRIRPVLYCTLQYIQVALLSRRACQ